MPSADDMQSIKWWDRWMRRVVRDELSKMGVPNLYIPGVVQSISQIPASSGKYFASVFLNGSSTASTNIPVNPDIAANVAANTPVWVLRVNFDQADLYVAMRKLS